MSSDSTKKTKTCERAIYQRRIFGLPHHSQRGRLVHVEYIRKSSANCRLSYLIAQRNKLTASKRYTSRQCTNAFEK